jgi:hypothetical protein
MPPEAENHCLSALGTGSYKYMLKICCNFALIILHKCKENGHIDK